MTTIDTLTRCFSRDGGGMPFVKLDCGILDSTLWVDRESREVFITALLLAEPFEARQDIPQIQVRSLNDTGWSAPPGWYGFVHAAGVGIVRRAMVEQDAGLEALERLGNPDPESRSSDFDGRRMIRVDGGYLVLNYFKYRDRDYTTAERSKRYRERRKALSQQPVKELPPHRDDTVSHRDITQAEGEGEGENPQRAVSPVRGKKRIALPVGFTLTTDRETVLRELAPHADVLIEFEQFCDHHRSLGNTMMDWEAAWRKWCFNVKKWSKDKGTGSATPDDFRGNL